MHFLRLPRLVLLSVACGASSLLGAEFDATKLDRIPARMQEFVDGGQLAGAVTLVGNKEGFHRVDAIGTLQLDSKQAMPKDAMFRIASMTKPITAMAVMILADRQKLMVTDPVEKYLPEFRGQLLVASRESGVTTLKKPSRPIAIRDLMTHTSGLPGGYPEGISDLYVKRHLNLAESVLVSSQRPLEFEPGSKWAYCNAGIDTLGRIVEVVSGESFEDFLLKNIFQPLGMTDTTFYPTSEQKPRIVPVYDSKDGKLIAAKSLIIGPTEHARHPIPAGGLYSTAEDLAKLYRMTLNGGKAGEKQIVSASALEEMTKVQTGSLQCGFVPGMAFGYGFAVVKEPQGITEMVSTGTFGHGGAFGTQAWIDPKKGIYAVLLIQRVGLPNADGSDMRRALQTIACEAAK